MDGREREHLRSLFERYHCDGDLKARDELVAAHLRLALHLARRFANRGVSMDDLEQVAALGLLHAVDRFDPTRGLEFSTFATPTIVGELKRYFRDRGWAVRVPRRIQELHLRLNTLVGDLTHRFGRSPTVAELAVAAQCSEEEVLEAMEAAQAYRAASIDAPNAAAATTSPAEEQRGSDDARLFATVNRVFVDELLAHLPPREQLIIRLRFYDEMTQAEIADRLGISQMHVSRLLARCLDGLRTHIETARRQVGP